jgi:hypothetical protein
MQYRPTAARPRKLTYGSSAPVGSAFEKSTNHIAHSFKIEWLRQPRRGLVTADYVVADATRSKSEGDSLILQLVSNRIAIFCAKRNVEDGGIWRLAFNQGKSCLHGLDWTKRLAAKVGEPVTHHHGDERLVFEHQNASSCHITPAS